MKVKKIEVKLMGEVMEEAREVMKAMAEGKSVEPSSYVAFNDLSLVSRILTMERVALLRVIKAVHPRVCGENSCSHGDLG